MTRLLDLPPDLWPRERLLAHGAPMLTDPELLAILLQTGTRQLNCLELAQTILERLGGLSAVVNAPDAQLQQVEGLGPARSATLLAAAELMRRAQRGPATGAEIRCPQDLAPMLKARLGDRHHEVFGVAFLNARNRLIRVEEMFRGGLTQTSVYPREIVARALQLNANKIIIFHNHPSGCPDHSPADRRLTQSLAQLLAPLEIHLWDHLVVAGDRVTSANQPGGRTNG